MTLIQGIILGIVQGLAEFLPISSSGHLLMFQNIFGLKEGGLTFSIILHIGTLIPVLFVYRKTIWKLIKNPFQKLTYMLILATIPTVILALLFNDFIEGFFTGSTFLPFGFIVTGILLIKTDRIKDGEKTVDDMNVADAFSIGLMQSLALPPGISRSGSTIFGASIRKLNRESAADFSFLMSIVAIVGSAVLEIVKIISGKATLDTLSFAPTMFGFVAAMLSGYLAITFMLKLIKEAKLKYFSVYLFTIAVLILIDSNLTRFFF